MTHASTDDLDGVRSCTEFVLSLIGRGQVWVGGPARQAARLDGCAGRQQGHHTSAGCCSSASTAGLRLSCVYGCSTRQMGMRCLQGAVSGGTRAADRPCSRSHTLCMYRSCSWWWLGHALQGWPEDRQNSRLVCRLCCARDIPGVCFVQRAIDATSLEYAVSQHTMHASTAACTVCRACRRAAFNSCMCVCVCSPACVAVSGRRHACSRLGIPSSTKMWVVRSKNNQKKTDTQPYVVPHHEGCAGMRW